MPIKIPLKPPSSNKAKTSAKTPPSSATGKALWDESPIESINLLVDKIAITAKIPFSGLGAIHAALDKMTGGGLLKPAAPSTSYAVVQLIALGKDDAYIFFDPKKPYFPDLRLEFNPAKAGPVGMNILRGVIDLLLPFGGWEWLVRKGNVSRLDVAVDLSGARMHHFHLLPQQVLVTKTYERAGKLKTIYVGSSKGNQLTVYSKSAQMAENKTPLLGPVVRIEGRLKNLGMPPSQLAGLENPFFKFSIVSTPPGPPPGEDTPQKKYIWTLFLDAVARRTLGPALKLLTPSKMTVYRKHFKGYEQPWWDSEHVWAQWPETLVKMRLVPTKDWPA